MTKKFISLLISVIMVVGLIPMSVSAEVIVDRYDTFETYTVKEFNTDFSTSGTLMTVYDTGDSSNYNQKFSLGTDLSLKIKEMVGYDGNQTNVAEITINSSAATSQTPGKLRLLGSKTYGKLADGYKVYVQEMDVYITDNPNSQEFMMIPIIIKGNKIGFGTSTSKVEYEDVTPGWHRVKAVTLLSESGNNVIGYLDGELVSYKEYTYAQPYRYFQLDTYEVGYKTIIFDNIKLWGNPDATTVSSAYSDASDVSKNVSPEVTFSESVLEYSSHSDGRIAEKVELIATSGATTSVDIDVSLSTDGKTLTIDPTENLDPGTEYTVKLTGLVDMYGREITATEFSFTTMEDSKISCAQPTFKKQNLFEYGDQGEAITSLENGYIRTDLTVSNSDTSEKDVFIIAVLKEDGDIKAFQFDELTVPASDSADFNCSFQIDDAANQTIETFVWDSFPGKTPLASKWTFTSSGCTETLIEEQ